MQREMARRHDAHKEPAVWKEAENQYWL
jgi:hypothetical protein